MLTFSEILPQRTSTRTLDRDRSTQLPSPTLANSNVSKTKSLMSHILYAAPVTINIVRWDAHHRCLEERSSILFGAVWLRTVCTITLCCIVEEDVWSNSKLMHDLWAIYSVHLKREWYTKLSMSNNLMLFNRTVGTPLELLFTRTAGTYFTAMDKWKLLHPVRLVCFTPWNMRWAKERTG